MTLDDLTRSTGEWLRGKGPNAEVVFSSRVRLARNLADFPFLSTASASDKTEIYRTVAGEIGNVDVAADAFVVDLDQTSSIDRDLLVERHLISKHQAHDEGSRGVTVWPDETRAVMINEEDHLRMQGLRSGLELDALLDDVNEIDDALARRFEFAYDRRLGFLTACPTNVGTGIRISVMLHLPALRLTEEIEKVFRAAKDMRLAVRGLFGEGTDAVGDLYQISNQTTLGKSESQIIEGFGKQTIPRIVEYEMEARDVLAKKHPYRLDDRIWRAYGVLRNARCISSEETISLLSHVRLGVRMGRFDKIDITTVNELFLLCQPAHLQKSCAASMDGPSRSVARADLLRERLSP